MIAALRYRKGQAIVLALLAGLVAGCVVFAPLYERAMVQSLTYQLLLHAGSTESGVSATSYNPTQQQYVLSPEQLDARVTRVGGSALSTGILSISVPVTQYPVTFTSRDSDLLWRQGMCAHVRMLSGRCPTAAGQVAISSADAEQMHLRVGSALSIYQTPDPPAIPVRPSTRLRLRVSGVYAQVDGPYWFDSVLTGQSGTPDSFGRKEGDDWLTARSTLAGSYARAGTTGVDRPINLKAVDSDRLAQLGPAVQKLVLANPASASGFATNSGLPDLAAQVRAAQVQLGTIVPLLVIQLGLLSLVVLWLVLTAAIDQRRPELAVARLRGQRVAGARRLLLGELLPAALLGVPIGFLAALGLGWFARHVLLPDGAPFEVRRPMVYALAIGVLIIAVTTVLAVQTQSRLPLASLLRRVPERAGGWRVGVLDAMVVAVCAAGVVALATGGLKGTTALIAPLLLALGVGLLLAHLSGPIAGRVGGLLLLRGYLGAGLGVLQVARRPATRKVVAVMTVATALLTFAADAVVVGGRNRELRAERDAGAAVFIRVGGTDVTGLRAALASVDPTGRLATPVVMIAQPASSGSTTAAVIPAGFAHIALFPGKASSSFDWSALQPSGGDPPHVKGTSLTVRLAYQASAATSSHVQPVGLRLRLIDHSYQIRYADLGSLRLGSRARTVTAAVSCQTGCDLTGIDFEAPALAPRLSGSLVLSGLRSRGGNASFGSTKDWQRIGGGVNGTSSESVTAAGALRVDYSVPGPASVVLSQASVPNSLPALITPGSNVSLSGTHFTASGLDGVDRSMAVAGRLPWLPGPVSQAVVVNLSTLQRDGTFPAGVVDLQAWVGRNDPALVARLSTALDKRGLRVTSTQSVSGLRAAYDATAPALGLQLAVVVGAAALLVAMLILGVVAATSWRLRRRDYAGLRASGVGTSAVLRAAMSEQLVVLVIAAVAGTVCGLLGAHLALPLIPLFATTPAVSTLDLSTAWGSALLTAAAALVVLAALGVLLSVALARSSRPRRLKDSA